MTVQILATDQKITVSSPTYRWEWDAATDHFTLCDAQGRVIGHGGHQPLIVTTQNHGMFSPHASIPHIEGTRLSIRYTTPDNASRLTLTWHFHPDCISLEPLRFATSQPTEIQQVVYFPATHGDTYKPSFYSRYAVIPGLCMSTNIHPVVDLHSRLSVTAVLGSGAMRGPGLTQQWGLPAHYFCTFNTSDRWNAIGAKRLQSGAACWGLKELPRGDFRLEVREIGLSPVLNLRSDLWHQYPATGEFEIGFSFLIAFGENFHEAIRNYYRILLREGVIQPKQNSAKKNDVLLAPQYNTWGVESALALPPEQLTETLVRDIFEKFRASGLRAKTFVIDDKWEGAYGELKHDEIRFPNFEALLDEIRAEGYHVGLWAAFLRCQDPAALGLNESHLLQTSDGQPLWLAHQTARYGIFDVTQPLVQEKLRERAQAFIRRYNPDLIKFDFGYELPSLDIAAPADLDWAGERLLQKGLEVIVGAMKEVNPDLVIMYYGLSPLLIEHYDLHSPDDLVYCVSDYDLETNRRIFFSSLCGELGMPTYGSSGYEWSSALDIWFDSVAAGALGSLHCFDGDENSDLPTPEHIAIFNGLSAIARKSPTFQVYPLEAHWHGGQRSALAPSWERLENGKSVLLALRTHRFDGKPAGDSHGAVLHTDIMLVVASLTDDDISHSAHLGIVPFGRGHCILARASAYQQATLIEHYHSGQTRETQIPIQGTSIELLLARRYGDEIVEWVEVKFS